MEMRVQNVKCVNVFKSLQPADIIQKYTRCWIELINQSEQRKNQVIHEK